jgi:hypothetical protein
MSVRYETDGPVAFVTIDGPDVANAVDRPTAEALADALRRFDADEALAVAVLTGASGKFCAAVEGHAVAGGLELAAHARGCPRERVPPRHGHARDRRDVRRPRRLHLGGVARSLSPAPGAPQRAPRSGG